MDAVNLTKYNPKTFEDRPSTMLLRHLLMVWIHPAITLSDALRPLREKEPTIKALPAINGDAARAAADESGARWESGNPLSTIDGMPIGIKDLLETKDMPTQMGCDAYEGNFPKRDNAAVWALRQAGAVILCKTVTAELGGSHPGPTNNPFDLARTAGGSSSVPRPQLRPTCFLRRLAHRSA